MVNEWLTPRVRSAAASSGARTACQYRIDERLPDPATRQEDIGTVQIEVVRAAEMGYNSHRPSSLGPGAAGRSGNSIAAQPNEPERLRQPNEPETRRFLIFSTVCRTRFLPLASLA
jgi:hypothetical protein